MADAIDDEIRALRNQASPTSDEKIPVDSSVEDDLAKLRASASGTDTTAPSEAPSASLSLGRVAAQLGRGVIEGTAGMVGLPGFLGEKIDQLVGKNSGQTLSSLVTGEKPSSGGFWNLYGPGISPPIPDPQTITGAAEKLGIYDPKNVPRNGAETAAEFLGAAAPSMAIGAATGMPLIPNALYSTVPGAIADKFSSYVPPWISAPLLALAGSRFGTGINALNAMRADAAKAGEAGTALENAQAENALALGNRATTSDASQAHQRESADFRLAQQTAAQNVADAAKAQKKTDIADALKAQDAEHQGANADREDIASRLGSSLTIQQGTTKAQGLAREWLRQDFPNKVKAAEDQLSIIPPDARGPLDNFKAVLQNSNYGAGEGEPIAELFQSNLPTRLRNVVDQLGYKQMTPEQLLGNGPAKTPDLSFADVRKLRSVLGDALKNQQTVRDVGAGKLNEMYAALSDDMRNNISNNVGPLGLEAFDKYNAEASRLYRLASGPVTDIISGKNGVNETISPGQVYHNLLRDVEYGGVNLEDLSSEPKLKMGLNEFAAANLRRGLTGLNSSGNPEAEFRLMSPEAKSALYGDENAGKIQDVIDRRDAADKTFEETKNQAKEQAEATKNAAAGVRQQDEASRSLSGTVLSQAATNAARRANDTAEAVRQATRNKAALDAKVRDNQNNSLTNIKKWKVPGLGALGGLGGAGLLGEGLGAMAHNALSGLPISEIPDIGMKTAAGIAGALGASGVKQLWRYPRETSRNMLMGTIPATSTIDNKRNDLGPQSLNGSGSNKTQVAGDLEDIEELLHKHATGELSSKAVKPLLPEGWDVDLRRGRYNYEVTDPQGNYHYIQG